MSDQDRSTPRDKRPDRRRGIDAAQQQGDQSSNDDVIPLRRRKSGSASLPWWDEQLRKLGDDILAEDIPHHLRAILSSADQTDRRPDRRNPTELQQRSSANDSDD